MKKYIPHLVLFLTAVMGSTGAWADECRRLNENDEWLDGIAELTKLYKAGDFNQVIKSGKKLQSICSASPILNYFIAKAYQETGDRQKELYYLQIATRNSQIMEVQADILEKMWRDRIYLEYPEVSPEAVAQLKDENERFKSKLMTDNLSAIEGTSAMEVNYKAMMWTGIGVASAGVVLLATGASLVALEKGQAVEFKNPDNPTAARAGSKYIVGWSLLGAGIAAAVAGATVAGVSGYFLTTVNENEAVSFNISPVSAGVTIKF